MVHGIFSKSFLAARLGASGCGLAAAEDTQVSLLARPSSAPAASQTRCACRARCSGTCRTRPRSSSRCRRTARFSGVSSDAHARRGLDVQFRAALSRCAWTPAADPSGVPITRRVRVPIRFEANEETGTVVARVGELEPVVLAALSRSLGVSLSKPRARRRELERASAGALSSCSDHALREAPRRASVRRRRPAPAPAVLRASGKDATYYLHRMSTQDLERLGPGSPPTRPS